MIDDWNATINNFISVGSFNRIRRTILTGAHCGRIDGQKERGRTEDGAGRKKKQSNGRWNVRSHTAQYVCQILLNVWSNGTNNIYHCFVRSGHKFQSMLKYRLRGKWDFELCITCCWSTSIPNEMKRNQRISCVCVHTFLAILLVAKVPFRHMLLRLLIFLDDHNVEWISMTFRELHMRLQLQLSMGLHRYSFNMWWKQIGGLDWIEIMYAIEKSNKRER